MEPNSAAEAAPSSSAPRRRWRRLLGVAAATLLLVGLAEGGLALVYHFWPSPAFRLFYSRYGRNIIQYLPRCAVYDPALGYRLRPGRFTFRNREFAVEFRVNSAGLRDDEASLTAPEVIVLGDSIAMGWGVEQDQTFARRLEAATGWRVLNAGISSYGTPRELKLLATLDTSALRALVIQYHPNDYDENETYLEHGGRLPVMSAAAYARRVEHHRERRRYNPLALTYCRKLPGSVLYHHRQRPAVEAALRRLARPEAAAFVTVLAEALPPALRGRPILVLDFGPPARGADFGREVIAYLETPGAAPAWLAHSLGVLDVSAAWGPPHTFRLDDHPRPSGHALVAEALVGALAEPPEPPEPPAAEGARR
jgi:hypothetical protein